MVSVPGISITNTFYFFLQTDSEIKQVKTTGLDQESHVRADTSPCLEILSSQFLINTTSPIMLSVYKIQRNKIQNATSFKSSITDRQHVLTRLKEVAHLAYSRRSQIETPVHGLSSIALQNPSHSDLVF